MSRSRTKQVIVFVAMLLLSFVLAAFPNPVTTLLRNCVFGVCLGFILGILYCRRSKNNKSLDVTEADFKPAEKLDPYEHGILKRPEHHPERDPHPNDMNPDIYGDGGRMT